MASVERFEDLRIWQKARELSKWFFELTQNSKLKEDYKLRQQSDGAIGSVMDNIAEGFERNGRKEFIQFLAIAKGSAGEFRSQLYRVLDRGYISDHDFKLKLNEIIQLSKGISSFIDYLKGSDLKGWKFAK